MTIETKWYKRNDVTGDVLMTKPATDKFRENYDAIFRKPKQEEDDLENVKEKTGEEILIAYTNAVRGVLKYFGMTKQGYEQQQFSIQTDLWWEYTELGLYCAENAGSIAEEDGDYYAYDVIEKYIAKDFTAFLCRDDVDCITLVLSNDKRVDVE